MHLKIEDLRITGVDRKTVLYDKTQIQFTTDSFSFGSVQSQRLNCLIWSDIFIQGAVQTKLAQNLLLF